MVDPTIPTGATMAAFIMTVISWYGMLRTGIKLIHSDIEGYESTADDIGNMLIDLEHQENRLNDWRRSWMISKTIPNTVLLQYWGEHRFKIINEKLKRIEANFMKTRKKLKGYAELKEEKWQSIGKSRRVYKTLKFILWKKDRVQELIDSWPNDMTAISEEADAGWKEQQPRIGREIGHSNPYHTLVAYLLVKIAMQIRSDAKTLRSCCQAVRGDVAIMLDLDVFDVIAAVSEDKDAPRICEVFEAGHLKLDLLLREADQPEAELIRVVVERSSGNVDPEARIVDAFRAVLGGRSSRAHFCCVTSTVFCLSKIRRAGDPCSRLQHTFRDILAGQDPPSYDDAEAQFTNHNLILGKLSTCRAAFELAQACLLLLRTTWFSEICRCGIRCGTLSESATRGWHRFGLELTDTTHEKPLWHDPYGSPLPIEGELEYSWCTRNYHWDVLNKPLRRLGLLLVEFVLHTIVVPEVEDDTGGAAKVTAVQILIKAQPNTYEWKSLNLATVLKLVKQSFHDSDGFANAIEHCLTGSFPQSPTDAEWEEQLRNFYFKVVKP
jgi:hypothetical protein